MPLNVPALVQQTTTTSGAGAYSLTAAASNYQNYRSFYLTGATVPYVCTDNANNFEIGAGILTYGTPDTISRTSILASSNAGSAVNWPDSTAKLIFSWRINGSEVTPQEFGAKGDGTTDDTAAVRAWFAYVLATGMAGRLISWYRCTSQLIWDLTTVAATGIKITGAGKYSSGLDLTPVAATPALHIYSSSGNASFSTFRDFGIKGNYAGITVELGDTTYTTELVSCSFGPVEITNTSNAAGAIALETAYLFGSDVEAVLACGGSTATAALSIRQSQSNRFAGSFSGANVGIQFTDNAIYGNTFVSPVISGVNDCFAGASTAIGPNHVSSGSLSVLTGGAACNIAGYTASKYLTFDGTNFSGTVFAAASKLVAIWRGLDFSSTPAVPASGTAQRNTSPNTILVWVFGGTVTAALITNPDNVGVNISISSFTGGLVELLPGEQVTLTYTVAPSWVWRPIL